MNMELAIFVRFDSAILSNYRPFEGFGLYLCPLTRSYAHWRVLMPTDTYLCPLAPTYAHWHVLMPTDTYLCPLAPTCTSRMDDNRSKSLNQTSPKWLNVVLLKISLPAHIHFSKMTKKSCFHRK